MCASITALLLKISILQMEKLVKNRTNGLVSWCFCVWLGEVHSFMTLA